MYLTRFYKTKIYAGLYNMGVRIGVCVGGGAHWALEHWEVALNPKKVKL